MSDKKSQESDVALRVEHISKSFHLPNEKANGIKQAFVNYMKGVKGYKRQEVLRDISFEVKKGDFFGIVGRNGSGKSTLLKLISQIYTPDSGKITVNGSLVPFIELGVGFNPELTGRENVYLNGAMLGFSKEEIEAMYDEIVEFAELHDFMDQKLKNYSSGMQVRLAFSVAIKAQGDILVLDEVLAVGDEAFQQKCFDYFASLKSSGKTVILVSHSMMSIERFCTKALLLEKGKILDIGNSSDIAYRYENLFIEDDNKELLKRNKEQQTRGAKSDNALVDVSVEIIQDNKEVATIEARKGFTVRLSVHALSVPLGNLNVGINIRDAEDRIVFSTDARKSLGVFDLKENERAEVDFDIDNYYTNGQYYIDVAVVDEHSLSDKLIFKQKSVVEFSIKGIYDHAHSLFHPGYKVHKRQVNDK